MMAYGSENIYSFDLSRIWVLRMVFDPNKETGIGH